MMLRIVLTVAMSVASCERSFSKLELIRSHLGFTMTAERLKSIAMLSIEDKLTEEIIRKWTAQGLAIEDIKL